MAEVALPRKRSTPRLPGNHKSDSLPGPRLVLCRQGGEA
jgi:hypothetical protein